MRFRGVWIAIVALVIAGGTAWIATGGLESEPVLTGLPPAREFPAVTDLAADADIDLKFASLSYGVHTFLWWNETYRTWDLDNVRQLNFAYVKQSFSWSNIQPEPDHWDWSLADEVVAETLYRGRRIVARIDDPPEWAVHQRQNVEQPPYDMDALVTYCGTLAERYAGQIEAYQIWNEPNITREWGDQVPNPKAYVRLLAACAGAIRESDPNAIIITAGLAPTGSRDVSAMPDDEYLWRMYEDADVSPHFDVLGLHAPGYKLPPEASLEDAAAEEQDHWARFRHVEDMRAIMVANGDAHKQIAITEMGWTTDNRPDSIYEWFGVSPQTQAEYLARAYAFAAENWRPWVGLMVTIYMSKDTWTPDDEQWWWAITEPADPPVWTTLRPAYFALANMEKISTNPAFSEPERDPNETYYLEPLPPRR